MAGDERIVTSGCTLVLGGQKSGKSRYAERLASDFLHRSPLHRLVFLVTAQAGDPEMAARILRHQQDRAHVFPACETVEVSLHLGEALRRYRQPHRLLVVDCLTLWLTALLMPLSGSGPLHNLSEIAEQQMAALLEALQEAPLCPVVLVSNEIGFGVVPLGVETRQFVDRLGLLNQQIAAIADHVTLMVAGLPLPLKTRPD